MPLTEDDLVHALGAVGEEDVEVAAEREVEPSGDCAHESAELLAKCPRAMVWLYQEAQTPLFCRSAGKFTWKSTSCRLNSFRYRLTDTFTSPCAWPGVTQESMRSNRAAVMSGELG